MYALHIYWRVNKLVPLLHLDADGNLRVLIFIGSDTLNADTIDVIAHDTKVHRGRKGTDICRI